MAMGDRETFATAYAYPGVYEIGENTQVPLSIGKPPPRAGVFVHGQALVVADNIADNIEGKTPGAKFDDRGGCFIESGFDKAGYGSGNFYAEPSPAVQLMQPSRRNLRISVNPNTRFGVFERSKSEDA